MRLMRASGRSAGPPRSRMDGWVLSGGPPVFPGLESAGAPRSFHRLSHRIPAFMVLCCRVVNLIGVMRWLKCDGLR